MITLDRLKSDLFPIEKPHLIVISLFSLCYITWTSLVVGFRIDHQAFVVFILSMFLFHRWTRTFVYSFVFFILFWVLYDSMRAFPNYLINNVHIIEPYNIEKYIFGISSNDEILTPNEYLNLHQYPILDILSGLFYLTWVPVPLALGIYLFFNDKKMLLNFSAAYLLTNLIGFIIYYSYPAAPPWYFEKYGMVQLFDITGNAAQLVRFDNLIGFPLFQNIYTKNSNVFAAIPSLHAAYPVVTWYYAKKKKLRLASTFIFIDILGIWFAAVYSSHHYIIDIFLGLCCGVIALLIYEKWLLKTQFSTILDKYIRFVELKEPEKLIDCRS